MEITPTASRLDGITLYESIDTDMLSAFKLTDFAKYDYDSAWEYGGDYGTEKLHLTKYENIYKKRFDLFAVEYTRGKKKLGRVYPVKSLGMTSIRRETRNTLMRQRYYDFDMDNAHPCIVRGVVAKQLPKGKRIDLEFPYLNNYCNNREKVIKDVMRGYACDRERAKNAFISLMYGGSVGSWKWGKGKDAHLQGTDPVVESQLDKFYDEIKKITDMFIEANPELYERECDNYRKQDKNKGKTNERGSFLSLVIQDYETKLVEHLLDYIMDNTGLSRIDGEPDKHIITYSFDGFMLLKSRIDEAGGVEAFLKELEKRTLAFYGFEIKWSSKNMNEEYHTAFIYTPPAIPVVVTEQEMREREREAEIEIKKETEKKSLQNYDAAFKTAKIDFEKSNFKVVRNSCFVQEVYYDGKRELIQRTPAELKVAFSHLKIKYTAYEGKKNDKMVEKCDPFIPAWLECENIRKYEHMDCFPDDKKCPPDCFNLWTPFEMERYGIPYAPIEDVIKIKEVKLGVDFLRNHLSIMCNHDKANLLEFEKWIAQMIQYPDVKTFMPIFQSDEGAGKGSFVTLMTKILGASKVSLIANPEEHVWGRFNNMMESLFLVFFDEISKQMTSGAIDLIKNLVTEPTMHIQHKGKGSYQMNSYHRFGALTNAWDAGIPTKKGSRRWFICSMSNEKKGVVDYWKLFYALIEDINVLRAFYHYYKTMEVPRVLPAPKATEFAKELAELSVDVPTLWLKDMIDDAKRNQSNYLQTQKHIYKLRVTGDYVVELSGSQAFQMFKEWCKENGWERFESNPVKLGVFLSMKKYKGIVKHRTNTTRTNYYIVDMLQAELEKGLE